MTEPAVLYERRGAIVYVTLNRPEKLHAMNGAIVEGLNQAWKQFDRDDKAWVAVLTSSGERAFCAGIDLQERPDALPALPGIGVETWKPIIVAIRGYCLGIGLILAMQCDIRIAAGDAQFGYPEARVGITGGVGAGLVKYMSPGVAMDLLLTGEPISGQRAYEVGFVSRVVPAKDVLLEATRVAEAVAANAPLVTRALKELACRGSHPTLREAHAQALRILAPVTDSEDAREGPRAFLERRKPEFKAR